jgi:hypothetical protein
LLGVPILWRKRVKGLSSWNLSRLSNYFPLLYYNERLSDCCTVNSCNPGGYEACGRDEGRREG